MTRVHPTAIVDKGAGLDHDVEIGPYSIVGAHVNIGAGTRVMSHVVLDGCLTIGAGCTIFPFASLGSQTQDLKFKGARTFVEVGDRTVIREYVTINSGTFENDVTRVGSDCLIMAYAHVAHQCVVGNGVIIANAGTLAGHVLVEDRAVIGGLCGIHQFVRIGSMCIVGGCSKITQDVPPYMMVDGNPPVVHAINTTGLERRNVNEATRRNLKEAHKILYRRNLSTSQAVEKLKTDLPASPEINHLIEFVSSSKRGIVK